MKKLIRHISKKNYKYNRRYDRTEPVKRFLLFFFAFAIPISILAEINTIAFAIVSLIFVISRMLYFNKAEKMKSNK